MVKFPDNFSNPIDSFLNQDYDDFLKWIEKSYNINLSSGFSKDTSKAMLEQEILFWIDENNIPVDTEKNIFGYLNNL